MSYEKAKDGTTSLHAEATKIQTAMKSMARSLNSIRSIGEHLKPVERWRIILLAVVRAFPLAPTMKMPRVGFQTAYRRSSNCPNSRFIFRYLTLKPKLEGFRNAQQQSKSLSNIQRLIELISAKLSRRACGIVQQARKHHMRYEALLNRVMQRVEPKIGLALAFLFADEGVSFFKITKQCITVLW